MQKNVDAMVQALVTDPQHVSDVTPPAGPRDRRRRRSCATAGALLADVALDVAPRLDPPAASARTAPARARCSRAVLGQIEFSGSIRFHWRGAGRHRLRAAVLHRRPDAAAHRRRVPRSVAPAPAGRASASRARRAPRIEALLARVGLGGLRAAPARRALRRRAAARAARQRHRSGAGAAAARRAGERPRRDGGRGSSRTIARSSCKREPATSVLMVSHDLAQVRRLADRVTLHRPRRSGARARRREVLRRRPGARSLALDGGRRVVSALYDWLARARRRAARCPTIFQYAFFVRGLLSVLLLAPLLGGMSHLVVARRLVVLPRRARPGGAHRPDDRPRCSASRSTPPTAASSASASCRRWRWST